MIGRILGIFLRINDIKKKIALKKYNMIDDRNLDKTINLYRIPI